MQLKYFAVFVSFLIVSCINYQDKSVESHHSIVQKTDTTIGGKDFIGEVAGSAYLKRATAYFVIYGTDSSDFKVVFAEEKETGVIGMDIRYDAINRKGKSFNKRMEELQLILPKAIIDYNFDSLKSISLGRLVSTGDLAVKISQEYNEKFDGIYSTEDYGIISDFLLESALANEINGILKPYHLVVSHVSIEKVFFTSDKKVLHQASVIKSDSIDIPDKILDCMIWIRLEKLD